MERHSIFDSSDIVSVGYDKPSKVLEIEFHGNRVYQYKLATPVVVELENLRDINDPEALQTRSFTFRDLSLDGNGVFKQTRLIQVEGRFYGTGHEEVGGWFNGDEVTGAFGGTRRQ